MNFMPGTLDGETVHLPIGDVRLSDRSRERAAGAQSGQQVIGGIRPESFEDASLVSDDVRDRGFTLNARIDLVEALGTEKYYFQVEESQVEAEELRELAEDAGTAEVPGTTEGQVVARVESASGIQRGADAELWLDSSKLHFFNIEHGRSLAAA